MANYPTSASSDANLYVAVNSLATSLVGALTSSGGNNGANIEVTSTAGFPAQGFITIDQEAISYTSLLSAPARFAGITRGADGTTATSHSAASTVKHNVIAAHHNSLKDEVIAVTTDLVGVMAALVPVTAASLATSVLNRMNMFAQQIKVMAGLTNWYDAPKPYTNLFKWQRPWLLWVSATEIRIPAILDPNVPMLFPDGDYRTINATTDVELRKMVITRNAVLSGSHQGGLRTSESEANNTWYSIYAVKTTDVTTKFVVVGTTLTPQISNEATLNSSFGTNGWVYLGMIRNGDNAITPGDILSFVQSGNRITFNRPTSASPLTALGLRLADTGAAASLTYTYASGTSGTSIPGHLNIGTYQGLTSTSNGLALRNSAITYYIASFGSVTSHGASGFAPDQDLAQGLNVTSSAGSNAYSIMLVGWVDPVLGVGSNPYL